MSIDWNREQNERLGMRDWIKAILAFVVYTVMMYVLLYSAMSI